MKKIIKEYEHFEKFMGYKAPEFKSDSGEFHVILCDSIGESVPL